jgi:hypothetical protein
MHSLIVRLIVCIALLVIGFPPVLYLVVLEALGSLVAVVARLLGLLFPALGVVNVGVGASP